MKIRIKSGVKAGGAAWNRSATLRVRSGVKAGGAAWNRNVTRS